MLRKRRARVGGYANYHPATVTLHYLDGTTWQPWKTFVSQSGYYSLRVPAGYYYNYYVSTLVTVPITISGLGTFPCRQTWADWSGYVKARRGRTYDYLNTTLQPAGTGCAYP